VPHTETKFSEIKDVLLAEKFFLVTEVHVSEFLNASFVSKFVAGGLRCSMLSHNTRLDCDDCVCLLPNGQLVLSLTRPSYERIPLLKILTEPKSSRAARGKSDAHHKFELGLNLANIRPDEHGHQVELLTRVFEEMTFSFYATCGGLADAKHELVGQFGAHRVLDCSLRVEANIHGHGVAPGRDLTDFELVNVGDRDDLVSRWIECENMIGCVTNQIEV
jgi:hypothetical protein